jgi:hypothetical protein
MLIQRGSVPRPKNARYGSDTGFNVFVLIRSNRPWMQTMSPAELAFSKTCAAQEKNREAVGKKEKD